MKNYLEASAATELYDQGLVPLEYPNQIEGVTEHPMIEPQFIASLGKVAATAAPHKLIGEAVRLFGKDPKRIIDIGCGNGVDALYLATQGHNVIALDTDTAALDWARERARDLNIPLQNFTPRVGDLRDISSSDRYQGVIANMVLHFLEKSEARRAARAIQSITVVNGLNVVSVYTEDNPEEEITHPTRALKYLFNTRELSSLYRARWFMHRDVEGYVGKPMVRMFGNGRDVLIPTVAEIIARKRSIPAPSTYMDADRKIVTVK